MVATVSVAPVTLPMSSAAEDRVSSDGSVDVHGASSAHASGRDDMLRQRLKKAMGSVGG